MGNLQLAPGSLFAHRFEIDRCAGSGGMGTVYRACDRYNDKVVALKLLHSSATGSDDGDRFVRESQILAELRHPSIVAHIAHGQAADGQRFLAMEWLDGEDLGQRLLRGRLPLPDCLLLLNQVAAALSVAHAHGIVHRDIKPTNLFLVAGEVARLKLLDFGIARRTATAHAMTRTGMVVGTPEYMAPEQARGVRELTPAADLFSLGCVLYECLVGQPPFVADHLAAVLVRILFEDPTPILERRPETPASLVTLLGQLLAKDPQQRPTDAGALLTQLTALQELPDSALAVTMAASPRALAARFAETEQSLFSIVLAASREEAGSPDATPRPSELLPAAERPALLGALRALGVAADFLVSGALVISVTSTGSATDQATLAARAALLVKQYRPTAVVAMATGRGALQGHAAVGEVVEQAARLLQTGSDSAAAKETSGIFVDALSAKLVEGRFTLSAQPGGELLLRAEREVDASPLLLGKPAPCVGRDAELNNLAGQLLSCLDESEARVVLVTASPGMGKSRLRDEFLQRVHKRSEPLTCLLGIGELMSAGAPYGILRSVIHELCGISGSEPLQKRRQLLRRRISKHVKESEQERVVLFIGELCTVPFPAEQNPLLQAARQNPKLMLDGVRHAFLDWLAAECGAGPVLLVLDDLQWSDELTISALAEALRQQAEAPLFVLALARPEVHQTFPKLWNGHKLQEIPLKGLSKKACERLIQHVLGKDVSPAAMARAVEQSSGNALFLEETVRPVRSMLSFRRWCRSLTSLQNTTFHTTFCSQRDL